MFTFRRTSGSNIMTFTPLTERAIKLVKSPSFGLEDWQWVHDKTAFVVELNLGNDLVHRLRLEGFHVTHE